MTSTIKLLLEQFLPTLEAWAQSTATRLDDYGVDILKLILKEDRLLDWLIQRLIAGDDAAAFADLPVEVQSAFLANADTDTDAEQRYEVFAVNTLPVLQASLTEVLTA